MVKLLDDMKKIADGDLTVRTDITHPTTGAIADAINCTIEELHAGGTVNQASRLVVKSSGQAQRFLQGYWRQHSNKRLKSSKPPLRF